MSQAPSEFVERVSAHNVGRTGNAIAAAARANGMTVFATIDHSGAAREAGLELADELVVLVGSPKVGTVLMQASPRAGIDLPLRILVRDDGGTTRITYRDPHSLRDAHRLDGLQEMLDLMAGALEKVVDAAALAVDG